MDYKYDLFISYKRGGNVGDWVLHHLFPVLEKCLQDELDHDPKIWFDQREERTGVHWPHDLQQGLLHSRMLLAVWSPPYFRSAWCLAEWKSMLAREEQLGMSSVEAPRGLVYPIVFSDGKYFPERAQATQARQDLSPWAYPYLQFRDSVDYLHFHDTVRTVAKQIADRIAETPTWQAGWPIEMPSGSAAPDIPLARL